jgi:hypothetical protein
MPQPQKCARFRREMTLKGFIDLPNSFQIYRKVKKIIKEKVEEE